MKVADLQQQTKQLHNKYHKKIQEAVLSLSDGELSVSTREGYEGFSQLLDDLCKLFWDLKLKIEDLTKEKMQLQQEKTKILQEKNNEIEKLLLNSEILSQEVITKSEALKHYESECAELDKNNSLLFEELQSYKKASALEPISETNEDNLLLLETQLEHANKRIQDLEIIVNDLENFKQNDNLMESELEYVKKQLNLTGNELSETKEKYKDLLNKYELLKTENITLHNDYLELKNNYDECLKDKQIIMNNLEKLKNDYENTEYKFSEVNISVESLQEEIDSYKNRLEECICSNESLSVEVESLRNDLLKVNKEREKLEEKMRQDKMSETSVRVQLSNEVKSLTEANKSLIAEIERTSEEKLEALKRIENLQQTHSSFSKSSFEIEELKKEKELFEKKSEELMVRCNVVVQLNEELLDNEKSYKSKIHEMEEELEAAKKGLEEVLMKNSDIMEKLKNLENESQCLKGK